MRATVDELILEEMARMAPPPDYLADTPFLGSSSFSSSSSSAVSALLQAELERMAAGLPPSTSASAAAAGGGEGHVVDMHRYDRVEAPPAGAGSSSSDAALGAWIAAVSRAELALEAQQSRALNLELMARYGVDAWKAHAQEADAIAKAAKARVESLTERATAVNAVRKQSQEAPAQRLGVLARRYAETVDMNLQTELACADAEAEVRRLRRLVEERKAALAAAGTSSGGGGAGAGTGGGRDASLDDV
jgi:pre-mRNA-splicing factor SPF27